MGYIRNHAMALTSWNDEHIARARTISLGMFAERGLEGLISPLMPYAINGGASFFIAPDGSKEGWSDSDKGDEARSAFKTWLRASKLYVDWAEMILGGDDEKYTIEDHADHETGGE